MQEALDTTLWVAGSKVSSLTPTTKVASAPADGADTITNGAPASRCIDACSLLEKMPVDSITMSTPRSDHGQGLRVALGEDLDLVAVDLDAAVGDADLGVPGAEDRVVLEEVGHQLLGAEVVGGDEVDVGAPLLGRPEEVAADATEPVDADADAHVLACSSFQGWSRPSEQIGPVGSSPAGGPPPHFSMSRWSTTGASRRARSSSATASAITTDRCRPPVHPKAMVRYALPSAT